MQGKSRAICIATLPTKALGTTRGEARREMALEQPGRKGEHRVGFIPKVRLWNCWYVKMRSYMDDGERTETDGFASSRLHRSVFR